MLGLSVGVFDAVATMMMSASATSSNKRFKGADVTPCFLAIASAFLNVLLITVTF